MAATRWVVAAAAALAGTVAARGARRRGTLAPAPAGRHSRVATTGPVPAPAAGPVPPPRPRVPESAAVPEAAAAPLPRPAVADDAAAPGPAPEAGSEVPPGVGSRSETVPDPAVGRGLVDLVPSAPVTADPAETTEIRVTAPDVAAPRGPVTERLSVLDDPAPASRPRPTPRPRPGEPLPAAPAPDPGGDVSAITEILAVTPPRVEAELRKEDGTTGEPVADPVDVAPEEDAADEGPADADPADPEPEPAGPVLPRVWTPRAPAEALSTRETAALARKNRARKSRAPRRVAGRPTPRS